MWCIYTSIRMREKLLYQALKESKKVPGVRIELTTFGL
jgi:hypothetical protein